MIPENKEKGLVWDSSWEIDTNSENFLGTERYLPLIESIYAGLGIPAHLFQKEEKKSVPIQDSPQE